MSLCVGCADDDEFVLVEAPASGGTAEEAPDKASDSVNKYKEDDVCIVCINTQYSSRSHSTAQYCTVFQ